MLNIIEPKRKKARLTSDVSTHINDTTSKNIVRKVKSTSRCCVGISDSTDDKIKLYSAESLRMNATFYETDTSLKINNLLPKNDLIKKKKIMSSIFTGIVIKTIDWVSIIEGSDGVFNLRSSKCDLCFSYNNIYDTLIPRCKSYQFLSMEMKKKLNSLKPPSFNISKLSRIDSISAKPVKSNIEIFRLRKNILI